MAKLGLLTLHGMGKVKEKYSIPLQDKLKKELGTKWNDIEVAQVQYQPALQTNQNKLLKRMAAAHELDSFLFRKVLVDSFSDATNFEYSGHYPSSGAYFEIQSEILKNLEELWDKGVRQVAVVAQSLGCQVLSNYLWDAQREEPKGIFANRPNDNPAKEKFLRLGNMKYLATTGCNIPLFVSGLDEDKIKCFKKPEGCTWQNFFDKDDALGWPLQPLSPSHAKAVDEDVEVNAGNIFTSWNLFSHGAYWKDSDVTGEIAEHLEKLF